MEGCVFSFLKAELKMNDTGLAHLASSSFGRCVVCPSSTNQKQELPMAAMFINGSGRNYLSV
jgi:hypothetical protein